MSKLNKIFRCGPVSATVWLNTKEYKGEMVEMHSIKIEKSYLNPSYQGDDPQEKWKHTHSFAAEDLPKVALVAQEAYKYIRLQVTNKNDPLDDNQE